MAYTVAFETEVPTSRKRKPVEKLAIPLWLEVNLGGEVIPVAGKAVSAGASAYRKGSADLCQDLN